MLEKILKVLESEGVIYDYEIIEDNDINIIVDTTVYNFRQEDNSFTLKITRLDNDEEN